MTEIDKMAKEIDNKLYTLLWKYKQEGMAGNLNLEVHDCRKKISDMLARFVLTEKLRARIEEAKTYIDSPHCIAAIRIRHLTKEFSSIERVEE